MRVMYSLAELEFVADYLKPAAFCI